jgi:hypothetical protein
MKNIFLFAFFCLFILNIRTETQIYQNYILIYGEGPIGQNYGDNFNVITYSKQEAVQLAKFDILSFLSGMLYGYKFKIEVENPLNGRQGYFEEQAVTLINEKDKNLTLRQLQEAFNRLKIQAIYRLREDHKNFLAAVNSLSTTFAVGEALGEGGLDWDQRNVVLKSAVKNAIIEAARKKYKSRPLFISGKYYLRETPLFFITDGQWRVNVKLNLVLQDVSYQNSY